MSKESLTDTIQQVQRLHHAKREAVGDVVNTNYSGDESHNIRLTSMGINKAFTDLLVEANRISGGFLAIILLLTACQLLALMIFVRHYKNMT
jgi:hypothetical protein